MSSKKEIGGYFSIECFHTPLYHSNGVMLNSGRNALRHILRTYGVDTLYVPFYTCPVVWEAVQLEKCRIIFYRVNDDLLPESDLPHDAFILYNNYFGVSGKKVEAMAARYPNLIVDNAQSFYSAPRGLAAFYSPRKFFGLPDGGIALCGKNTAENYPLDTMSHTRASHLLIRPDLGAPAGYAQFSENDDSLCGADILQMSPLTLAMMGNIDYDTAKQRRLENFRYLNEKLEPEKLWDLAEDDVPMVYPYKTDDSELRKKLISEKIFVAAYWPGMDSCCEHLRQSVLPLPLDQRYDLDDMKRMVDNIKEK